MHILLKYTIKSMLEKKIRSILIILAVSLAGALYLASTELSDSIKLMYEERNKQQVGNIDLIITPNENSPSIYLNEDLAKEAEGIKAVISTSSSIGNYKIESKTYDAFRLQGFNLEDYMSINKLVLKQSQNLEPFTGAKLILSKKAAEKYDLELGERITLKIEGINRQITLVGIAEPKGIFADETEGINGMMPFDTLSNYLGGNGKPGSIYITLEQGAEIKEVQKQLKMIYAKYDVEEAFDEIAFKENMSWITQPFLMMTIIVVFMSIFIIYSSFKVVMLEKLPVVGTFRSIGADKRKMNGVLMLESILYGVLGGIMACVLGVGALYVLSAVMIRSLGVGGSIQIQLSIKSFVFTFLLANILAIASTIIPILSVSKISLKDIILNSKPHKSKSIFRGAVIGAVCTIGGIFIASIQYRSLGMIFSITGTIVSSIGVVKLVPFFTYYMACMLAHLFGIGFGNIGTLAGKNLRKNKSILNSITLITLGITYLLMIVTVTSNISDQMIGFYQHTMTYEVRCRLNNMNKMDLRTIKANEDVNGAIASLVKSDVIAKQVAGRRMNIEGIAEGDPLDEYMNFNIKGDSKALLNQLQEGRNMIINEIVARKNGLEIGDTVDIDLDYQIGTYKIIGFMDTMWNGGDYAIVPIKYLRRDTNQAGFNRAYIKIKEGADANELAKALKKQFEEKIVDASTTEEMMNSDAESTAGLLNMITAFAMLAMFIGIVGVVNNLIIGFIERKQGLAVFKSIGMSKGQVLGMIFIEGLGSGIIGATGGALGGLCMIKIMGYVLYSMQMPFDILVIPSIFPSYMAGGVLITLIGSILPARSSSKLNIIEAIKYE